VSFIVVFLSANLFGACLPPLEASAALRLGGAGSVGPATRAGPAWYVTLSMGALLAQEARYTTAV